MTKRYRNYAFYLWVSITYSDADPGKRVVVAFWSEIDTPEVEFCEAIYSQNNMENTIQINHLSVKRLPFSIREWIHFKG